MSLTFSYIRNRLDKLAARKAAERTGAEIPGPTPPPPPPFLDRLDGARLAEHPGGRLIIRAETFAAGEARLPLSSPEPFRAECLPMIDRNPGDRSAAPGAEEIAFLDTETTGLAGGTGTVAFLIGIAWWERTTSGWLLRVEQGLIEDFCHEAALLDWLCERLRGFRLLCTYNGKGFDLPLLRTRAVMNRVSPTPLLLPQADLLYPARRLWRPRLGTATLQAIEAAVLRIDRGPDIEGALIPQVFFDLVREGDAPLLPEVLRHNAQDLATLAALLALIGEVTADPLREGLLEHWKDLAGMARWHESLKQWDEAAAACRKAAGMTQDSTARGELLARLAHCHKRKRQWDQAIALWSALTQGPPAQSLPARLELAKYYEHTARDYSLALEEVHQAVKHIYLHQELAACIGKPHADESWLTAVQQDLNYREARLRRKIEPKEQRP